MEATTTPCGQAGAGARSSGDDRRREGSAAPEFTDRAVRAGFSRALAGQTAALLLMASGALSLASLVRPDAPDEDPMGVLLVGCAAALIGLGAWFLPWRSWPRSASLLLLPVGFTLIAARNVVGGEDPYLYAVFYIVLFMWVGMAHPSGTAFKALPLFVIAYLAPLWTMTILDVTALTSIIYIGLLCLLVGETLSFISGRWRKSQSALLALRGATEGLGEYLARANDPGSLWQGGLEQMCSVLDIPNGDLYRLGQDGQLTCLASVVGGEPYPDYLGALVGLELWAVDREAMRTGEPALVTSLDDVRLSADERSQMLEWDEHAVLVVPLFSREGVVGLVELGEVREGRTITAEQAAAAVSVCRLLAFSVHDAELVAAQKKANRKLTMLYEISRAVAGSATMEQALEPIVRDGATALGLGVCIAFEYDGEGDALVARARWERTPSGRDCPGEPLPLADHPAKRRVLESGEPQLERISDPELAPARRAVMEQWGESMCLTIPMGSCEGPMGLLTFWDERQERDLSDAELALARSLADLAGEAIRSNQLVGKLRLLSETDALTGLANHRRLRAMLRREETRARRYGSPFAVMMIDVDRFKLLNDAYGHPAGDSILIQMARLLEEHTRATDVIGRYGGDEFLLLLPETTAAEASVLAENLRQALGQAPYVTETGEKIPLHMSIGISGYPEDHKDVNGLIAAADANLYASKRRGGDVVTSLRGGGSGRRRPLHALRLPGDGGRQQGRLHPPAQRGGHGVRSGARRRPGALRRHAARTARRGAAARCRQDRRAGPHPAQAGPPGRCRVRDRQGASRSRRHDHRRAARPAGGPWRRGLAPRALRRPRLPSAAWPAPRYPSSAASWPSPMPTRP